MTARLDAEWSAVPDEVRDLLLRRAERIAREPGGDEDERALWVASFPIDGEEFAIPLSMLRAAVPLRAVTPVPRSAPAVLGVLSFEGEVIAALRIAVLLGRARSLRPAFLLVVDAGDGHTVAIDCAEIPLATTIPTALLRAAPTAGALTRVSLPARGPVFADTRSPPTTVTVVDLPRLLAEQSP